MGSSSSHMNYQKPSSKPSKDLPGFVGSILNRTKRKLSSLFCGASASKSTYELEHCPEYSSLAPISDDSRNSMTETSSLFRSEVGNTSFTSVGYSSRIHTSISEETFAERSRDQTNFISANEQLHNLPRRELFSGNATVAAEAQDAMMEDAVVAGGNYSDLRSLSTVSDSSPQFPLSGNDHAYAPSTSSSGLLMSNRDQDLTSGDVVSVSSNLLTSSIAEINSRESRRNRRTLFRDELSRHGFRGHNDSPTNLRRHERRRLLRSGTSERIIGGPNERDQQTTFCATGMHSQGTCSCDLFFTEEEFSALASISRIIMLAETLFEVLDEINHQSLSLFMSSLSLPAPESVVDAFPVKYHKKTTNVESDSQQCHICLVEYEADDKLRVLPCNHEYHLPCIDKWLKEVNRVCPLCRYDVCEDPGECSASNMESSTL